MSTKSKNKKKAKKKKSKNTASSRIKEQKFPEETTPSFVEWYIKKHKMLLWIPIAILILALIQISYQNHTTGSFIHKGISLKGGTEVYMPSDENKINVEELEMYLKNKVGDARVRKISEFGRISGYIIETTEQNTSRLKEVLKQYGEVKIDVNKLAFKTIGAELSESFFKEILQALMLAFILMAIVVFLRFKALPVSIAVILSAFSDIVVTISILNIFGFKFSVAGIAALLMLVGYSVDTDILLSTRIIKEQGTIQKKFIEAFKTGITMTLTTLATVIIAYFVTNSIIIKEIMLILLVGLLVDIINTWIQNASILLWYIERKESEVKE